MHYWSRVTKERRAVAGAAHAVYISLLCQLDATARLSHYDAYTVASTDYAASYSPNGRLADGTIKKTPSVRESTGQLSVSEKRFSTVVAPLKLPT